MWFYQERVEYDLRITLLQLGAAKLRYLCRLRVFHSTLLLWRHNNTFSSLPFKSCTSAISLFTLYWAVFKWWHVLLSPLGTLHIHVRPLKKGGFWVNFCHWSPWMPKDVKGDEQAIVLSVNQSATGESSGSRRTFAASTYWPLLSPNSVARRTRVKIVSWTYMLLEFCVLHKCQSPDVKRSPWKDETTWSMLNIIGVPINGLFF